MNMLPVAVASSFQTLAIQIKQKYVMPSSMFQNESLKCYQRVLLTKLHGEGKF